MQREYSALNCSPFRLRSESYADNLVADLTDTDTEAVEEENQSFFSLISPKDKPKSNSDKVAAGTGSGVGDGGGGASSFAQRYVDEIAPAAKLREYEALASTHKAALLREAQVLKVQFSDDMQESRRMEQAVSSISVLVGDFVQMIEAQSDLVGTIGEVSEDATEAVKQTDAELLLTLERSQSHQWSMVGFILGMAALLLLLDFLTP
jgi:hypothetical protein